MVKVAIAGGNSGLALEIIDKLVEFEEHEVIALCRRDPSQFPQQKNVTWVQTKYDDKAELVKLFQGVETVLNFFVVHNDPGTVVSRLLVDAAIEAGVKRYAPSEWAMGAGLTNIIDVLPAYQGKLDMQAYLRDVNKDKKVLEFSLIQCGMFMEYSAFPRKLTKHVPPMATAWQFEDQRIVIIKGFEDQAVSLTSVEDIANVVKLAIEYQGEWPEVGGISGQIITPKQLQELVQKVTGKPIALLTIDQADLDNGLLTVDMPLVEHPSLDPEVGKTIQPLLWTSILSAVSKGAWLCSSEWNQLLPDYQFTSIEEFVKRTWN